MVRLPQPGGDAGNWGDILNEYLSIAHKADGTLASDTVGVNQLKTNNIASNDTVLSWNGANLVWVTPDTASVTSVAGKTGDVILEKSDVGLTNVDNTSDSNKPISTATQSALNAKVNVSDLKPVATSGSYTDLTNKPTIPTVVDATTSTKGIVQLSGDLGGSAAAPTVPGLATKVNNSSLGAANGVATLDGSTLVPASQLPMAAIASSSQLSSTYASAASVTSAFTVATRGAPNRIPVVRKVVAYLGSSGHGFAGAANTGGSYNLNDTANPMIGGTQSIQLAPGINTYARADKTGMTPFSVRNKMMRLVLKCTNSANLLPMSVRFASDSGFANQISQQVLPVTGYAPDGEEFVIDVPLGSATVTGTPDLDNITAVRFFVNGKPTVTGTVNIGALYLVDQDTTSYPNGVLVIGFDDCHLTQYTQAFPYMAKFGFPGTLYPNIERMQSGAGYSISQAKYMQNVGGWDFGAHAFTSAQHVDHVGKDEAWLRNHFESIISFYKDNNFRSRSFAWPNTTSDSLAQRIAADYFTTSRGGGNGARETLLPIRPMNLRATNTSSANGDISVTGPYIDRAVADKSVLIVFFHEIVASGATGQQVNYSDFTAFIDRAVSSGIAVATISQLYG